MISPHRISFSSWPGTSFSYRVLSHVHFNVFIVLARLFDVNNLPNSLFKFFCKLLADLRVSMRIAYCTGESDLSPVFFLPDMADENLPFGNPALALQSLFPQLCRFDGYETR